MSAFEGSMKSMLQGVSQQLARERLEGQITAQENMLSDLVTGLRRRPGAQVATAWVVGNATKDNTLAFDTDIGQERCKLVLNGADGKLRICNDEWGLLTTLQNDYLKFADRTDIQHTVINDRLYILNKKFIPTAATKSAPQGGQNDYFGYFFIKSGAYSTAYTITVSDVSGSLGTWSYTTPDTTVAGASAASTPLAIASALVSKMNGQAGIQCWQISSYVYIRTSHGRCSVTTTNSSSYVGVSNTSHAALISELPSKLPSNADGYTIAVGSTNTPSYYAWQYSTNTWLEGPASGSALTLKNMPMYVYKDDNDVYQLDSVYEGRLAGDDDSNPDPNFMDYGIDGIGAFQGRLVMLSGSKVTLSASGKPYRFWRSTIEDLLPSDPIEVGASANSSAAYQYCVPFNKDLILFSEKYQALVPGGGQLVTPSNATVVVTSTYEGDMSSSPLTLGRTLMFPAPRSVDYYGIMEMLPSQYTDSQYVSADVTSHLPKYMAGRCRFSVSSSVASIACFASTTDYKTLVIHEYTWDGNEKAQQAWHRWTFPYDIADAFFSGNDINLVFASNGNLVVATIDPRAGTLTSDGSRRPFLDLYFDATVADNTVSIPPFYQSFDPNWYKTARLSDTATELMGEEAGVESRTPTALVTVPSFDSGQVTMGQPYRSSIAPSMPTVKDQNGVVISSNKLTLLRLMLGTENSYEYEAIVQDSADDGADADANMSTLYWGSADLDLGAARIATESVTILPCRTNASSTTVVLYTDGLGEMNFVSLEYTCRYNQKLRRR